MLFYLLSCCDDVCFAARAYYAMAVFFSSSFSFATPPSTTTAGGAGPQAEGLLVCRTISGVSLMSHVLEVEGVSRLFMYTQGALSALCMYRDVHTGR